MENEIRNSALEPADVPERFTGVEALEPFALSFDGYAHWGDRCAENADRIAAAYREQGTLPDNAADLRACIFYEQQRWRWIGREPDDDAAAYLQALLDALRAAAARTAEADAAPAGGQPRPS